MYFEIDNYLLYVYLHISIKDFMESSILLFMPGPQELLLIAFVVLLFFGGKKLPELMKGLGKGIREFNNAKANIQGEIKDSMKEIEETKK